MDNFQTNRRYALIYSSVVPVILNNLLCFTQLIIVKGKEGISVFASIVDFNRFCWTSLR